LRPRTRTGTTGLGWLILAEPVTVPILLGGVIVVPAVAVVVRSEFQQ
jgi:drug/metabolite transporter (DMT)-like permease